MAQTSRSSPAIGGAVPTQSSEGLSGEIPAELGNLAGLKHLGLHGLYGKLSGQIPPELGNLTNLVNLRAS